MNILAQRFVLVHFTFSTAHVVRETRARKLGMT